MTGLRVPASRPCGSCPYRRDVPSGIWATEEYEKLPRYDGPTGEQPVGLFACHQQDGRLCAGWVACHDMTQTLAVRMAVLSGRLTVDEAMALVDYRTDVSVWPTGRAAADHGLEHLHDPDQRAVRTISRLIRKGVAT